MKIAICGSLSFSKEMGETADKLTKLGFDAQVPFSAVKILSGEFSQLEIDERKEDGTFYQTAIKNDAIKRWHNVIKECDAILVLNFDKKGIKNYIGGNSFLEIGFAYVMDKKIYLLNPIPEVSYKDEVMTMQPVVLDGDLSKIQS